MKIQNYLTVILILLLAAITVSNSIVGQTDFVDNSIQISSKKILTRANETNNITGPDADNDGIVDSEDSDDDNDGLPDIWEDNWNVYAIENGFENYFDSKNNSDASMDWDNDGYSNINEYIANTNPYNPRDYPIFGKNNNSPNYNWFEFLLLMAGLIIIMMIITIIIGIHIIKKRRKEDSFYTSTFGKQYKSPNSRSGNEIILRDKYMEWSSQIEAEQPPIKASRYKYKLEIIGGGTDEQDYDNGHDIPKSDLAHRSRSKQKSPNKHDPKFKGRSCLWCDKAITRKYIKKCTGMRSTNKRCTDGPFCSKICLNEHLDTVPHHRDVTF